ncbi:hypothetical protein GALMADRAFT_1147836, partial [Galerina marginata CBS 339.88]
MRCGVCKALSGVSPPFPRVISTPKVLSSTRVHPDNPMVEPEQVPLLKKKTPKVWNIYDHGFEFTYAPPKPDGDPWDILLKPRMDEDKIRCQAWKEEVNNLLIFAGLFSAVVTAFVAESYKTLQPDPNSAVVDLLSRIATRLDNPLNEVSPMTSAASFSPPPSSIRINILWFL